MQNKYAKKSTIGQKQKYIFKILEKEKRVKGVLRDQAYRRRLIDTATACIYRTCPHRHHQGFFFLTCFFKIESCFRSIIRAPYSGGPQVKMAKYLSVFSGICLLETDLLILLRMKIPWKAVFHVKNKIVPPTNPLSQ